MEHQQALIGLSNEVRQKCRYYRVFCTLATLESLQTDVSFDITGGSGSKPETYRLALRRALFSQSGNFYPENSSGAEGPG